jgi:hypothetical protein
MNSAGGPFYTQTWSAADLLLMAEVMFIQDLYARASGDADNIALTSGGSSGLAVTDISSQFDGSKTTFTVPTYTGIILFIITGWPPNGALRPSTDFTTPSSTTVSLQTGQVTAPAAGTTGLIIYAT